MRWIVLVALAALIGSAVAQTFEEASALASNKDAKERLKAVAALRSVHDIRSLRLLVDMFDDRDGEVRYAAGKAFPDVTQMFLDRLYRDLRASQDKQRAEALRAEIDSVDEFKPYVELGDYLADVNRAITGSREDIASLLESIAKNEDWKDDAPEKDEVWIPICGRRDRSPEASFDRVVAKRPEDAYALFQKKTTSYRCAILASLGKAGYRPAWEEALQFLKSRNITFRAGGVRCLAAFGGDEAFERLLAMRSDKSVIVRYNLTYALADADPKRAIVPLIEMMDDPVEAVGEGARFALDDCDDGEFGAVVKGWLDQTNKQGILKGLNLLMNRTVDTATPRVMELLRFKDWEIRELAVRCLEPYEDPRVQRALILTTKDSHVAVRIAATRHLYGQDNPEVWSALIDVLQDKEESVVKEACEILARMEVVSAIAPLRRLLTHRSEQVRRSAQSALDSILGETDPP